MRALRTSHTAPVEATKTALIKKYFSKQSTREKAPRPGDGRGLKTIACRSQPSGQLPSLGDVGAENGTDLRKCAVESGCQPAHASRGGKGNHRQDQQICHETLARFILMEAVQ